MKNQTFGLKIFQLVTDQDRLGCNWDRTEPARKRYRPVKRPGPNRSGLPVRFDFFSLLGLYAHPYSWMIWGQLLCAFCFLYDNLIEVKRGIWVRCLLKKNLTNCVFFDQLVSQISMLNEWVHSFPSLVLTCSNLRHLSRVESVVAEIHVIVSPLMLR